MNANNIAPGFVADEADFRDQNPVSAAALLNIDPSSLKRMTLPLRDWIQLVSLDVANSFPAASDNGSVDAAYGPNGTISNGNPNHFSPVLEKTSASMNVCIAQSREARKAYASNFLSPTKLLIDRLVLNDLLDEMLNRVTCHNDFIQPQDISMENLMVEFVHFEHAMIGVGFNNVDELIDHSHSHLRDSKDPIDRKQLSIAKILQECSPVQIRQIVGCISGIDFSTPTSRKKRRISPCEALSDEYYRQIGIVLFGFFSRGASSPNDFTSDMNQNLEDRLSERGSSSKEIRLSLTGNCSGHHVKNGPQDFQHDDFYSENHGCQVQILSQPCKSMKRTKLSSLQQQLQKHSILLPISRLITDLIECRKLTSVDGQFLCLEDIRYEINQMLNEPEFFLTDNYHTKFNTDKLDFRENVLYGRSDDLKALELVSSISRIDSHSNINNVVFLRGDPGVGKSSLVKGLKFPLISEGWLFFCCKFDRIARSEPLSIVSSGLNSFLGELADLKEGIDDIRLENNPNMRNIGNGAEEEYMNSTIFSIERFLSAPGIVFLSDFISNLKRLFPEIFQSVVVDDDLVSDEDSGDCNGEGKTHCTSSNENDVNMAREQGGTGGNNEANKHEVGGAEDDEDNCLTVNMFRNRLHYLFRRLLRALSSPRQHPILFFVDDVQWADSASLELISSFVLDFDRLSEADGQETPQCLMVLAAYRSDEVHSDHMLNHYIESFQSSASARVTTLNLEGLTVSNTIDLISDLLKLPIRWTRRFASTVHKKSLGNPFFVKMFMSSLLDDHKLSYSIRDRCWKWDIEDVKGVAIEETVATIMSKKISRLPVAVIEALIVASCLGVRVDKGVICSLSGCEQFCEIIPCLEHAMQEGIIEQRSESYYVFAHDTIQQTVYDLIPPENMKDYHFKIGLQLLKEHGMNKDTKCSPMAFIAIDQINRARDTDAANAIEPQLKELIVSVNVSAAERAIERADASSALSYVAHGKRFLGSDGWTESYDYSLRLNDAACLASYLNGSPVGVTDSYNEIKRHATGFEDKMKSRCILIQTCASTGDVQGAIEFGLDLLDGLDEYFPFEVTREDIDAAIESTKALISDDTKSQILNAPKLSDQKKLWSMKLMSLLASLVYLVNPSKVSLIGTRMIQISFQHGVTQESAIALVSYGITHISALNDIEEGYRWAKLALLIIDRFKAQSLYPKIYFLVNYFASIWKEPIQALVGGLRQTHRSALIVGDIEYASFAAKAYVERSVFSGKRLSVIEMECAALSSEMVQLNQIQSVLGHMGTHALVLELLGSQTRDPFNEYPGRINNCDDLIGYSLKNGRSILLRVTYCNRLFAAYLFARYDEAAELAQKYRNLSPYHAPAHDIFHAFYEGLTSFKLARTSEDSSRWVELGTKSVESYQDWVNHSSWNFKNKLSLLEAELYFCKGEIVKAKEKYEEAIEYSRRHNFIHEEGISLELFGSFHEFCKNNDEYRKCMASARSCYEKWEAYGLLARDCFRGL